MTQHDVQEFNRVLQDKLEEKMKKTDAEGTIEKLFRGTTYNYIRCIKIKLESIRKEDFYGMYAPAWMAWRIYADVTLIFGWQTYLSTSRGARTLSARSNAILSLKNWRATTCTKRRHTASKPHRRAFSLIPFLRYSICT